MWIFPVGGVTSPSAASTNTDTIPQFTVQKELNVTQVDVGAFCLVTITISNLSNTTAYHVRSKDTVFPTWAFTIKGDPTHKWESLENLTSVKYFYVLSPKKPGTFQLQWATVTYSNQNGSIIRSAFSNEIELYVPPIKASVLVRDVEGLQTILFAEITLFLLLLVTIFTRRKVTHTQTG